MWRIPVIALLLLPTSLTVDAYPRSGVAPLSVRVRVTIPKDKDNRAVCVFYLSADSDESESCWSLDGEHAPQVETRFFTLPQGVYEVGAVLERATPPRTVEASRERVIVTGLN